MQIKDANGKVIGTISLESGCTIQDLISSISTKKSSLNTLVGIDESADKKRMVFKFSDGSIFYDLTSKTFIRENGVKIGENSFRYIKLEIANKVYIDNRRHEIDNFWVVLSEKTSVPWIKTFFKIIDVWANKKFERGWLGVRERIYRNKLQKLSCDKQFFDSVESFAKLPSIQSLNEEETQKFYREILSISNDLKKQDKIKGLEDSIIVNVGKSKMDSWFFDRMSMNISEVYFEDQILSNFIGDYIKCVDNNIKNLFQYVFETYGGVIEYEQIENIKELIKFGYEPKRLLDYLYRDIYNQGLDLGNSNWAGDLGALQTLYDYAKMNIEMKKDYEKYPRYLSTLHNIAEKNYKLEEDKILNEKFSKIIKNLKKLKFEYSDNNYSIIVPKNAKCLIKEGQNLSHCVASYYTRMANSETTIVFLRKKDRIKESLVTLEISTKSGYKIVQAKGKSNSNPQASEMEFINKYEKYLLGTQAEKSS